jgi:hypothetical protein
LDKPFRDIIIRYSYLGTEHLGAREERQKDRPCAIISGPHDAAAHACLCCPLLAVVVLEAVRRAYQTPSVELERPSVNNGPVNTGQQADRVVAFILVLTCEGHMHAGLGGRSLAVVSMA